MIERGDGLYACPPPEAPARFRLKLLANILRETIERYYIVGRVLTAAGALARPELETHCRVLAARMSKLHGIDAPDFSDDRLFRQFVDALIARGAVTRKEGRLHPEPVVSAVVRAARQVIDDEFPAGGGVVGGGGGWG